jgi:hypothetical protein
MDDFDPAAFGLPTGFGGGKSKVTSNSNNDNAGAKQPKKQLLEKGKKRVDENDTVRLRL